MTERATGLLLIGATLLAYQVGLLLYRRAARRVWLHPLLTGTLLMALLLTALNISFAEYRQHTLLFDQLLGLATVALALPLHREFHHLKAFIGPVMVTVIFGSLVACATALGLAALAGGSHELLLALAPKSVTTPIALSIAEQLNANTGLTTGVVIFTGILGALMAPLAFRVTGLQDPRSQGLVLGINAHGVGTARAFETNPITGAFASLAMGLTGAFTALWLPATVQALTRGF